VISEGVIASCQGLFDVSSTATLLPVLLSLLLSRILRGSPRTAGARERPAELPLELPPELPGVTSGGRFVTAADVLI
jgi:hypothetical protein